MKDRNKIIIRKAKKKHAKEIKRAKYKRLKKARRVRLYLKTLKVFGGDISFEKVIEKWLPSNLKYIVSCPKSEFHFLKLKDIRHVNNGHFKVPKLFSIVDYPKECFDFIRDLTSALLFQKFVSIKIDYGECKRVDLGAQVFLDVIISDILKFYKKCRGNNINVRIKELKGINIYDNNIRKLLFSVGSPAIHSNRTIKFQDIIPYKLCVHDRESNTDSVKIGEKKDLDTTTLADYVIECLKRLNKKLTPEKLDDLCTVIGEILINAEEHSTTKYRFSIGYFHEQNDDGKHYGIFRLVIMNFGKTIYEKFKDPSCGNVEIVRRMQELSKSYTKRKLWFFNKFEEETLWTLYALQEGVTSVATDEYRKRGNGSIRFIESFFNIKGRTIENDEMSRMSIYTGNTQIQFDGKYDIKEREINGENFKVMTFNKEGDIEEKPDNKYVKYVNRYFPGTIISAKILFNEDDLM